MKKWSIVRVSAFVALFLSALLGIGDDPIRDKCDPFSPGFIGLLFFMPFIFVLTIMASSRFITPLERDTRPWHKPSLSISPFQKNKPLQFWFFGGLAGLSLALGGLLRLLIVDAGSWTTIMIYLCSSSGLLLGCYTAVRFFRGSFLKSQLYNKSCEAPGDKVSS